MRAESLFKTLSDEIASVVEAVLPSTVTISGGGTALGSSSSGSGWIFDDKGHIVTNAHVVVGLVGALRIKPAGRQQVEGQIVGVDKKTDLAVIRCDDPIPCPPIKIRKSSPRLGELCLAVGSPLSLNESASLGIISGLSRQSTHPDGHKIEEMIQTDASINPGNSGGPLLDASGQLLGVNTLGIGETVSFAVSSETVLRIVPELIEHGSIQRATIGISIASSWLLTDQGHCEVIRVCSVSDPQSPLEPGDFLLSMGAIPVKRRIDIQGVLCRSVIGRKLSAQIMRDGRLLEVDLTPRPSEN